MKTKHETKIEYSSSNKGWCSQYVQGNGPTAWKNRYAIDQFGNREVVSSEFLGYLTEDEYKRKQAARFAAAIKKNTANS